MPEASADTSRPRPSISRTIAKNTVFVTLGDIALRGVNFLFGIFVVRQLGDDQFGRYSIVLAFVGLFQIFAELGMSQYVMREIAQDRSKAQPLFWNLVEVRLLLALLAIIGIPLGAVAVGYSHELVLGVLFYTFSFLLAAFQIPLVVVLTAHERLDYATVLHVFGQLLFVVLGGVALLMGGGFIALILVGLMSTPIQIGAAVWMIKRERLARLPFRIDPRSWPRLIRASLPFGIISLALTIAFSIDTVMLSMYEPENVVGWYNVAYGLVRSLMFLFGGFSQAIVPSLSRAYVSDTHAVELWYHRSVKVILLLSLPLAVGGMLVAFPLIRFLYTDAFLPAAVGLQVIIWDVPLLMFTSFCGNMTTVVSEERSAARIYSINAVANVILNLYAIPRFGLIGAALVTVVTDLIGALQFHFLLRRKLHLPNLTSVLARALTASAVMGVGVAWVGHLDLFVRIGVGVLLYAGLVLALRLIDDTERAALAQLLRGRREPHPTKGSV